MLKKTLITFLSIMTLTLNSQTSVYKSIHQFKVADIYGNIFDFSQLKGKKVMIVNTASKCGLTYQYEALQKLYSQYKDLNFVIIGFPSNDFLWQEPGSNDEIIDFCEQNYGVTFPMMSKITVKGSKKHPIYQFLTEKSKNNYKDSRVTWNFQKYLINKEGRIEKIISPRTRPDSEEIVSWITDVN
jgi:glutathione peroxidase|tara:strand:+ start:100 stop:654 length:555 start_codon:yes stop_codon:yes gene_type:complete